MDNAFSRFLEEYKDGIDRFSAARGVDIAYLGLGSLDPASPEAVARSGFLEFLGPREFDGVLIVSSALPNSGAAAFRTTLEGLKPLPMVSIGPSVIGEESVLVDSRGGIGAVMAHLIADHGYRDFAYVSGPAGNAEAAARLEAYASALEAAAIPFRDECVFAGDFMPLSGLAAVDELLGARGLKPRAIVCANDLMAIGVRDGLAARGLAVPYDIAVTGFDDITILNGLTHQFTTVRQSFSAIGYAAASRLFALASGAADGAPELPEPELIVRGSCGCVDLLERRAAEGRSPSGRSCLALAEAVESAARAGLPEDAVRGLKRDCAVAVREAISEKRPVEELERAILGAARALPPGPGSGPMEAFALNLHAIMEEESSQNMFMAYWRDAHTNLLIRLALDRLQEEIMSDLSWDGHAEAFREAAVRCQARRLHFIAFLDGKDLSKGARTVFSFDQDEAPGPGGPWRPGPGAWLPPRGASLVANMVNDGADRFGYFLMDSAAIGDEVFERFRVRLSQIQHDAAIMRRVQALNVDMAREIEIRQNSERKLMEALALVEQLAVSDQLTGLNNRRGFLAIADQQVKLLRRKREPSLILFADLDGLKSINDRWGHKDGDLAIQGAARVLRESLRDSDVVGRIGGDEFTALVYNADPASIDIIKDRIRKNSDQANRALGREWKISLSIGFFHAEPDCALDVAAMLEKADAALYEEKKRNKPKPS
jgi:diguanylate cyclase (GGDEF)-like protein